MDDATQKILAQHVIQRLGEGGLPPEFGVRLINVGNDSYLEVLDTEYFQGQLRIGSSFKLVQGYFGAGKTHFLHCVRELAWDYRFITALVELSPAECPYDDSLKVYQAVARRLAARPSAVLTAPSYGLADLIRDHVDDQLEQAEVTLAASGEADPAVAAKAQVRRWLERTVGRAPCESHSYRQAVVALGLAYLDRDDELERALAAWLSGEPVPPAQVRPAGVYEQLGRANGFTMLRCLCQMMVALGFAGTALLFDEVDRNLSVGAKRSQVVGDNLRQVIDLCGRHQLPHTLFMYAVPPEFMRVVVPDYPALYQRLKTPVPLSVRSPQAALIDLERLDLEPADLLRAIGERVVEVFERARGIAFDRSVQDMNARLLAHAATEAFFEVNHRRLFVKTWVDLLHRQAADGERRLSADDAAQAILGGHDALTASGGGGDDFEDF